MTKQKSFPAGVLECRIENIKCDVRRRSHTYSDVSTRNNDIILNDANEQINQAYITQRWPDYEQLKSYWIDANFASTAHARVNQITRHDVNTNVIRSESVDHIFRCYRCSRYITQEKIKTHFLLLNAFSNIFFCVI